MAGNKKTDEDSLPRVAVSVGDPSGIGPEVAAAAARDEAVRRACRPVLFWPRSLAPPDVDAELVEVGGREDPSGAAALASLEGALDAVTRGGLEAMATAPMSKERTAAVEPGFTGHTEWLARRSGLDPREVVMIFTGPRVRTACVTRHVPLSEVPSLLDGRDVAWASVLLHAHLHHELGIERPRIAVAGLNPHASDGGLLGAEERTIIAPAVDRARRVLARLREGGTITGPLAADGAFRDHVLGVHDAVLGMFHDQATIASKIADPFLGVNTTAGLPFVRTSPDHGTADALAGSGRADPGSMRQALLLAARLAVRSGALRHRLEELREALRSTD